MSFIFKSTHNGDTKEIRVTCDSGFGSGGCYSKKEELTRMKIDLTEDEIDKLNYLRGIMMGSGVEEQDIRNVLSWCIECMYGGN